MTITEKEEQADYYNDIEDSKLAIIKIVLIVILFSPFFSSAVIFLLFAGFSNLMYYLILITIVLYLSYYSISYYRRSTELKNSLTM